MERKMENESIFLPSRRKNDRRFAEANGRQRKLQPKGMWEQHHVIARLIAAGRRNGEIAEIVGCTPQTVSNVRNNPQVQAIVKQLMAKADEKAVDIAVQIKEIAPKAVEVLKELMEEGSTPPAVRCSAAKDILDRIGARKAPAPVANLHMHLTADDIKQLKERAKLGGVVASEEDEVIDI
jgi:DNA-binding Lrp family transcriptional regulator